MREDNQAQVISLDQNRVQQLQADSPGYQMIAPGQISFNSSDQAMQMAAG